MNNAQQNTAVNTHIDTLLHYTEMYSFQMKLTIGFSVEAEKPNVTFRMFLQFSFTKTRTFIQTQRLYMNA